MSDLNDLFSALQTKAGGPNSGAVRSKPARPSSGRRPAPSLPLATSAKNERDIDIKDAFVDVTPLGVTGKEAEHVLDGIGITVNKNAIPFDPLPPNTSSGIRVGTPATTTRGFGPDEMREVGSLIVAAIERPAR